MKPGTAKVLALLKRHPEGITPLQALYDAGTFRLPARVWELRQAGYVIEKRHAAEGVYIYRLTEAP